MAIQTTYDRYMPAGFEGALSNQEQHNIFSRNADVLTPFGVVILQGATDGSCKLADGSAAPYLGVSVRDQSTGALSPNATAVRDSVRIADKGAITVKLAGTVTAGQSAAYLDADGGFVAAGTANSTGIIQAKFAQAGVANDLVTLRLG